MHFIPQIQNLNIENVWLQMHEAPPLSTAAATQFLNEIFQIAGLARRFARFVPQ